MAASWSRRARWWAEDYATVARLQLAGMTSGADPRAFRSGSLRPCVVVPGVYETWHFMRAVIDALHRAGHPVFVLPELRHNRRPVLEGAGLLAHFVAANDLSEVFIAAHSKGGLIGKYAMLELDPDARLAGMAAIATPFSGSRYANWAPNRTLRAFRSTDPVTAMLAAEDRVNERITSVFGEFDEVIPEGSALPGARNVTIPIGGHFQVLTHPATLAAVVAAAAAAGPCPPRSGSAR